MVPGSNPGAGAIFFALKKGINDVIQGFDEYTLAKYKGDGKSVKMRDLLCLCRPTPKTEAQSDMWKRLLEDKLEGEVQNEDDEDK